MSGTLPESYRRLASFSQRLPAGSRLYEQGAVPDRLYVVLKGQVLFEALSEQGEPEVVAAAGPGGLVGHVAAITGRPTSAAARVEVDTVLLAVAPSALVEVLREAPELGVQLIHAFAGVEETEDAAPEDAPPEEGAPEDADTVTIQGTYDLNLFFTDTAVCPVSQTRFQFLRVRTRAVRPSQRDSDFHVRYHGVDPTRYGVVVCPTCAYASYWDDFTKMDETARARLWEDREARMALADGALSGVRDSEAAVRVLELAMRCYEVRGANDSRRAVLQHRRAWVERDEGNEAAEQTWLARARESYQRAFESDTRISEEAAARIAYLVGDISMRLGDSQEAAQWLETAVRVAPQTSSGIVRTARDRLQDVRDLIKRQRSAA